MVRGTGVLVLAALLVTPTAALAASPTEEVPSSLDAEHVRVEQRGDEGIVVVVDLPLGLVQPDQVTELTAALPADVPQSVQGNASHLTLTVDPNRLCGRAAGLAGPLWDISAQLGGDGPTVPALPEVDPGAPVPSLEDVHERIEDAEEEVHRVEGIVNGLTPPGTGPADPALEEAREWIEIAKEELDLADDRVESLIEAGRTILPVEVPVSTGTAFAAIDHAKAALVSLQGDLDGALEDAQAQLERARSAVYDAWDEAERALEDSPAPDEVLDRVREQGLDPDEELGLWGIARVTLDLLSDPGVPQDDPGPDDPADSVREHLDEALSAHGDDGSGGDDGEDGNHVQRARERLQQARDRLEVLEEEVEEQTSTPAFEKIEEETEQARALLEGLAGTLQSEGENASEDALAEANRTLAEGVGHVQEALAQLRGVTDDAEDIREDPEAWLDRNLERPDRLRIKLPKATGPSPGSGDPTEDPTGDLDDGDADGLPDTGDPTDADPSDEDPTDGQPSPPENASDPCRSSEEASEGDGGDDGSDDGSNGDGSDDGGDGDSGDDDSQNDGNDEGDGSDGDSQDRLQLSLEPSTLSLTEDEETTLTATVTNPTDTSRSYQLVADEEGPVTVTADGETKAEIPAGESHAFTLTVSPLDDGDATVTVEASTDGEAHQADLPARVEPTAGDLRVAVSSSSLSLDVGEPAQIEVQIENVGQARDEAELAFDTSPGVNAQAPQASATLDGGETETLAVELEATEPGKQSVAIEVISDDGAEIQKSLTVESSGGDEDHQQGDPGSEGTDTPPPSQGDQEASGGNQASEIPLLPLVATVGLLALVARTANRRAR